MEDSQIEDKILNLGKAIVKELELEPGVDTLSKWMAHYVAEKIVLAENLNGESKKEARKECFETVLKLWEHRWSIPHDKPFLQDFEPLLETINKLNPNKETPFFLPPQFNVTFGDEGRRSKNTEPVDNSTDEPEKNREHQNHLNLAIRVDQLARSLIAGLLNQATSEINLSTERKELIRNSIKAIDYPEREIIRIMWDRSGHLDGLENDVGETRKLVSELKSKIDGLEELISIAQSLVIKYQKKIVQLEKC